MSDLSAESIVSFLPVAAGFAPIDTYATYTFLYCICMRPKFFLACTLPDAANFANEITARMKSRHNF